MHYVGSNHGVSAFKKYLFVSAFVVSMMCFTSLIFAASDATNIKIHVNNLTAISCDGTAQRCLAIGFIVKEHGYWFDKKSIDHVVYATEDGGNTWSNPYILPHPPTMTFNGTMKIHCDESGVACLIATTASIDLMQDIIVYTTEDAGLHWNGPKRLNISEDKSTDLVGVACSKIGDRCLLLAQDGPLYAPTIYKTQDAGQTWSSSSLLSPEDPHETYHVRDISCSDSGLQCMVVGGVFGQMISPLSYTTQDGGLTWISASLHDELNSDHSENDYFSHSTCDSTGLKCIALRYQEIHQPPVITYVHAYTTLDGGLSWQKTGSIGSVRDKINEPFSAVECDKVGQYCMAIYSPVGVENASSLSYVTHDGGITWRGEALNLSEKNSLLLDIFCDDEAFLCQIVGMRDPFLGGKKSQKL